MILEIKTPQEVKKLAGFMFILLGTDEKGRKVFAPLPKPQSPFTTKK